MNTFDFTKNAAADPIEAWIERLAASNLTTTAKCIGLLLAHYVACGGQNPMPTPKCSAYCGFMRRAGLDIHKGEAARKRADNAIVQLQQAGFIRRHLGKQVGVSKGVAVFELLAIEVLTGEGAR